MVGVADHESAIPVDGHKGPSQGSGDNGGVDKARVCVVAEVKRAQVKEVENKDELCPDEVGADKEHDECEMEEIVEDEVAADTRCGVNVLGVGGEKMGEVPKLQDEEDDPVYVSNDGIQGEGSAVEVILVPDTPANCESIVRLVDNIVDRDDNGKEPGQEGEDLVGGDSPRAVRLSPAEGIGPVSHGGDVEHLYQTFSMDN